MGTWTPGPGATSGNDVFTGDASDETVDGLGGDDVLDGGAGEDHLFGNAGNDILRPGDDFVFDGIDGGSGTDTLDLSQIHEDGFVVSLGDISRGGTDFPDTYNSTEIVWGSQANDRMNGSPDFGGSQDLYGLGGDDYLASFGNEVLHGGSGRDVFTAAQNSTNNVVADFEVGVDLFDGSITAFALDGADTILTFAPINQTNNGFTLRIVGVTGLSLAQWQSFQISSASTFSNATANTYTGTAGIDWVYLGGGNDNANGADGD